MMYCVSVKVGSSACHDKVWNAAVYRWAGVVSILVSNQFRGTTHHCQSAYLLCAVVWNKLLHLHHQGWWPLHFKCPPGILLETEGISGHWGKKVWSSKMFLVRLDCCSVFDCIFIERNINIMLSTTMVVYEMGNSTDFTNKDWLWNVWHKYNVFCGSWGALPSLRK